MIILTKNTDLVPQPRTVDTFPSGLVRVTQTYIGRTALKATHRAILAEGNDMPDGNSTPCIDGLKIFPAPQERAREDGMTEYIVTAYGRVNTTGKKTLQQDLGVIELNYKFKYYSTDISDGHEISYFASPVKTQPCTLDRLVWEFCVPKNAQVPIDPVEAPGVFYYSGTPSQSKTLLDILGPNEIPGYFFETGNAFQLPQNVVRQINKAYNISSIDKKNFGLFDEWIVTYSQKSPSFNFANGYWVPARAPLDATISNLQGADYGDVQQLTVSDVWNLDWITGGLNDNLVQNYVELTDTFQATETGRAKIKHIGDTYSITTNFGYYPSGVDNIGTFTPFSRPAGGTVNDSNGIHPPATIMQGAAEWKLSAGTPSTGNDSYGMRSFVYNLKNPLYAWYRWKVTNEFGQSMTFLDHAVYDPETLVPPSLG